MDACDEMVICNAEMAARDVSLAPFATEWTKKSRKASHRSSKPSSDATAGKCARASLPTPPRESVRVSSHCFDAVFRL